MKRARAPGLLLVMLVLVLPAGRQPNPSAANHAPPGTVLWRKAVATHKASRDWFPERISILSEVLNRRGEPRSITELYFSLRLGADNRMHTELTRALKNGEDRTAKMRAKVVIHDPRTEMPPDDESAYSVSISDSPFDPERQGHVSYRYAGEKRTIFGRSCERFDFSYRTAIVRKGRREELTWSGMAWLEEGSGLPVKLEFSLSPLPSRIRSLWAIYLYETSRPDRWVLRKATLSGHGGFLFISKRFRTTTTFSDYRRPLAREANQ